MTIPQDGSRLLTVSDAWEPGLGLGMHVFLPFLVLRLAYTLSLLSFLRSIIARDMLASILPF